MVAAVACLFRSLNLGVDRNSGMSSVDCFVLACSQTTFAGRTAAFKPAVAIRSGVARPRTVAVRAEGITGQ
jgi:hypothetical protein